MADAGESAAGHDDIDWDETVDVLCVGTGPGSLAYANLCTAQGLDVLIVESAHLDPQTLQYRRLMTEDLDGAHPDSRLALGRAEPVDPSPAGKRAMLEAFVGEELRQWSAQCWNSPFGVLLTEVPDLVPMRTVDGRSIVAGVIGSLRCDAEPSGPALQRWLQHRAEGLFAPAEDRLGGLIHQYGRIAGVTLDTSDGPRRIGTAGGLALPVGGALEVGPVQPELAGRSAEVAVVGRRGGRFARVELLSIVAADRDRA